MNGPEPIYEPWQDWIEDYLDGTLDEARLGELEKRLHDDPEARCYFVRRARLGTDLHLEMRARQASARALDRIERLAQPAVQPARPRRVASFLGVGAVAAGLMCAIAGTWWLATRPAKPEDARKPVVAWLVNAQNCEWSDVDLLKNLQAGDTLNLERGLAEIRFDCGAQVVLAGPARLELLSGNSARLLNGKLTAHAPEPAAGFAILSPQGKVIDLGTEFGIAVDDNGATAIHVFEGKVSAQPAADGEVRSVSLTRNQSARIAAGKVTLEPDAPGAEHFVRAIVPPPVITPRTLRLTFTQLADRGIRDAAGLPTGLTHRLPGTGSGLPEHDPNLKLDVTKRQLELTTTKSDINTQYHLAHGEYLGVRLSDLGFTGTEDFAVTVTIPDIPALESVGQFGLYAGARSNENIRGGVIRAGRRAPGEYTQFLVNNHGNNDSDYHQIGWLSTGADLRLTLQRKGGKYSLAVENLTAGGTSTLTIRHPAFLDQETDLYVGLFGANTQSDVRRTLVVKDVQVTVWTRTND
jgi:hypothetical protein